MIKIDLTKENVITIKGHANFDDEGKDIVCASVSSIAITTINAIIEINKDAISYSDKKGEIILKILKEDEIVNKLINNMILLFEDLEKDYKNYIKIIRR